MTGRKTEKEKFAGAEYTLTVEALMYNGVCLQSGTSHYFGQKFSKSYDIKFLNKNNELEYAYQTSWGVSNRMIGALIMVHGDDNGLIIPPNIAPLKSIIIPIGEDEEVRNLSLEIKKNLEENDISCDIDFSEKSPGFKFAEAEVRGVPVRIEIGKRDLDEGFITFVRRDTREKIRVSRNEDIVSKVKELFSLIQNDLYVKAKERMESMVYEAYNFEDFNKIIKAHPGFIKALWCGNTECELKLKDETGIKSRCILEDSNSTHGKCAICGKEAKHLVVWGIQY